MIKLQEQNPRLVTNPTPDTPPTAQYRKGSTIPALTHGIHRLQSEPDDHDHDHGELEQSEELSDHERHEPDEDEEDNGFLGDPHHKTGETPNH